MSSEISCIQDGKENSVANTVHRKDKSVVFRSEKSFAQRQIHCEMKGEIPFVGRR
jgi:catabolite regulation protein CreA